MCIHTPSCGNFCIRGSNDYFKNYLSNEYVSSHPDLESKVFRMRTLYLQICKSSCASATQFKATFSIITIGINGTSLLLLSFNNNEGSHIIFSTFIIYKRIHIIYCVIGEHQNIIPWKRLPLYFLGYFFHFLLTYFDFLLRCIKFGFYSVLSYCHIS